MIKNKKFWWGLLWIQFLPILVLCSLLWKYGKGLRANGAILVSLDILCIIIALLFYLSILRSGSGSRDSKLFLFLLITNLAYLFSDGVWHFVEGTPNLRLLHILVNVVYLICPVCITLIYWHFLDIWVGKSQIFYRYTNISIRLIAAVHIFLTLLSPFTGLYFNIMEDGEYMRGNLYILTIVLPFAMVMLCIARIIYHRVPRTEGMILLAYLFPPVIAAIVQGRFPGVTILAIAIFIFVALIYTNYYVRKEAEITNLERDLTESKLKSLQMQINPHFLYNTLHSIAGLCDTEPQVAQEMIYRVSDYMRDNFTDIDKPSLLTFREELAQLDHYLAIESMRFPNIIIEKDIEISDFPIPVSTLQPLVENSIKHGIGRRKKSTGTITISSVETDDAWVVRLGDDGVGFDNNAPGSEEGHYGLENVRRRLEMLCNGTLKINSTPGQGTIVEISIPKKSVGGYRPK